MKTIIAGSRSITDPATVWEAIKQSGFTITEVVSGGARGPDSLGERWAKARSIPIKRFTPDWEIGNHAGIIRNQQMAHYADALVAIWDGKSRGTKHMIDYAVSLGLKVWVFNTAHQPSSAT